MQQKEESMQQKERLDVLLVERGLAESREKAKAAIMAGLVFVKNQRVDKAGTKISVDAEIAVKGNPIPYVGRGGLKLEKAMETFPIDLTGVTMMDIGASTGGFTDCALQNGAASPSILFPSMCRLFPCSRSCRPSRRCWLTEAPWSR